jgi:hypothetical protein
MILLKEIIKVLCYTILGLLGLLVIASFVQGNVFNDDSIELLIAFSGVLVIVLFDVSSGEVQQVLQTTPDTSTQPQNPVAASVASHPSSLISFAYFVPSFLRCGLRCF